VVAQIYYFRNYLIKLNRMEAVNSTPLVLRICILPVLYRRPPIAMFAEIASTPALSASGLAKSVPDSVTDTFRSSWEIVSSYHKLVGFNSVRSRSRLPFALFKPILTERHGRQLALILDCQLHSEFSYLQVMFRR